MMLADSDRPRLAPKVRLRADRISGKSWLLYPERGLLLDGAGAEIAALCDGALTVAELVDYLATRYTDVPQQEIAQDVAQFLGALAEHGLLERDARESPL